MFRRRFSFLLHLACLVALAACAASEPLQPFEGQGQVWPEPPERARISFVGEFTSASDLGIKPGFWGRIVSFAAGARNEQLVRPMAVAATADSRTVYVADPDARCVHRFDLDRSRYNCLAPSRSESLGSPVGLALTDAGRLYVADSLLQGIYVLEPGEKWLQRLELGASLEQPTGIAWDEDTGTLYVADTAAQVVKIFAADGSFVNEFGGRGGQPGQFNFPTYLWLDGGGELVVTDSLNFRVQRFDSGAGYISAFGENGDRPGDFARPKGVAVDRSGHVYVVDGLFHAVQIFDRAGTLLLVIGEQGQERGKFWLPNGIFVTDDDTIFVTDAYNRRVQVFRYLEAES